MEPIEAAFLYGPVTFIGLSCVGSVPLAKRLALRFARPRRPEETFWERPALGARAVSLLAALSLIWCVASALGLVALAIPDPRGPATELRFDAALLVHAIPPLSARAATRIADELRRTDGVARFAPSGEMERRYVAAARIDPRPERAIAELAARGFRIHAGRFALASPTNATCDVGLDALAEAMQGAALQDLMRRCRNAPGDGIGFAAFKMGDFARSVGAEAESIISRQPRSPVGEPSCFAGGFDVPPASQPVCRLLHAEMISKARAAIYAEPVRAPRFAALWWEVARLAPGEAPPADTRFTIDPELLVRRPRAALRDQPIAVLAEIFRRGPDLDDPIARAWVRLAVAASVSLRDDRDDAAAAVSEALDDIGETPEDEPQRTAALRLALAVAIRTGRYDVLQEVVGQLPAADPLVVRAGLGYASPTPAGERPWVRALMDHTNGEVIAEALHDEVEMPEDLGRLSLIEPDSPESHRRAPLREWVQEDFPACVRCDFGDQLDRLTLRLDAARALGDDDLAGRLDTVYRRYEAVVFNRVLALSLRASEAP